MLPNKAQMRTKNSLSFVMMSFGLRLSRSEALQTLMVGAEPPLKSAHARGWLGRSTDRRRTGGGQAG